MRLEVVGSLAFAAALSLACGDAEAKPLPPTLGTNLAVVKDWSEELPFVDLMHSARTWISGRGTTWNDNRPLDVDAHGDIRSLLEGQVARTIVSTDRHRPAGKYILLYDGSGEFTFRGFTPGIKTPGRIELQANGETGMLDVELVSVDPKDPPHNLRVLLPGGSCSGHPTQSCTDNAGCGEGGACVPFEHQKNAIFNPDFIQSLHGYKVVRFIDWGLIDFAPAMQMQHWSDRPTMDEARWAEKGVPLEIMVELCNQADVDAWIHIPHKADDDYVRRAAQLVHDRLNPKHKVYLEYSNEVWNWVFQQAHWAQDMGVLNHLGKDKGDARLAFYAWRAAQVMGIWDRVFAGDRARLVRVLATQSANVAVTQSEIAEPSTKDAFDALAIAPYFGHTLGDAKRHDEVLAMSVDAALDELENVQLEKIRHDIEAQARVARQMGVDLITYEGGQHLVGLGISSHDAGINRLFDDVNRSPRMKTIYQKYLKIWQDAGGGGLFMHFNDIGRYTLFGRWGSRETLQAPRAASPKYDALMEYIGIP